MVGTHCSLRQLACSVTSAHAARRNPSTCRSHPSSWYQLAKIRLAIFNLLIPHDWNLDPK